MSKWLASIQSLEEANVLLPQLPDILDMKDPAKGALGALQVDTVSEIVKFIAGRCKTSATIGDLPMNAEVIAEKMTAMATSGVDYVKIGFFADADLRVCIEQLATIVRSLHTPVIAVLFVDKEATEAWLPLLKKSGFYGVMLDTAIKKGQHLRAHWSPLRINNFVKTAHDAGLVCGLAGALRYKDIVPLSQHGADYLGFRSALCQEQNRQSTIDRGLVEAVRTAIKVSEINHKIAS